MKKMITRLIDVGNDVLANSLCEELTVTNSGNKELLQSMNGHVIQYGCLMGIFKNPV